MNVLTAPLQKCDPNIVTSNTGTATQGSQCLLIAAYYARLDRFEEEPHREAPGHNISEPEPTSSCGQVSWRDRSMRLARSLH